MTQIVRFETKAQLVQEAADRIAADLAQAITERGRASFVLSGGSTPKPIYEKLAQQPLVSQVDWSKVAIFWGDERTVPPEDEDSNYRMANEAFLQKIETFAGVYRLKGEINPAQAATEYERQIRDYFGDDEPAFDVVLLGMGGDGHTASLFPATNALNEADKWIIENYVPKLESWRLTMTTPLLNQARQIYFLVAGESKADALKSVLEGDYQPDTYPSQLIMKDRAMWLTDAAAAAKLEEE